MARVHTIGWELNSAATGVETQTAILTGSGLATSTTQVRTGTYSLKATASASGSNYQVTNSAQHGQFMRFFIYITTAPGGNSTIALFADESNGVAMCFLDLTSSRTLLLFYSNATGGFTQLGSASAAIALNTWTQVEMHIDDTGGTTSTVVEARLAGSVFATGTVSIEATGNAGVPSGFSVIGYSIVDSSSTGVWYFDDYAINDSSGSHQTSYPGSSSITRITPNAQGDANSWATQVGGTAGSANNFTRVDETTPDNATSYNGSTVLSQQDLFKCTDPAIGTDTVNCVQVMATYRNNTVDATTAFEIQCEKTTAGTIASGASIDPDSTTWKTCTSSNSLILYNDPDGNAWTESTLSTMQIGYKLTTAHTNAIDVTAVWAYVDHTPASGVQYYSSLATTGAG